MVGNVDFESLSPSPGSVFGLLKQFLEQLPDTLVNIKQILAWNGTYTTHIHHSVPHIACTPTVLTYTDIIFSRNI